tara:strand:+ start:338 stop:1036 length:699 start_codon:yes stop_codon:yes gene_type:complete
MRQIALDTETTGINTSDGHRIIEIGCIEMENRRITGKEFHCYINPEREIDEGATRVHGLTYEKLKNEPLFKDIKSDFMNFISGSELIIHNADFDIGFLNYELSLVKSSNVIEDKALVLDTLKMARNMHPGKKNSLDALCNRYEIDRSMRQVHGALIDADLLAKVYLAMTGGQETFELNEAKSHDKEEKIKIQRENSFSLKVIKANSSELDAHENFLSELRDKGECIWNHEAD